MSSDAELVKRIGKDSFLEAMDTEACLVVLREGESYFTAPSFHSDSAAHTTALIQRALAGRVLNTVMRAFAPARHKDDRHTRKAFELLAKPEIFEEVATIGSRHHLKQACDFWAKLDGSPRLERLKHYRDKRFAHTGELDPLLGIPPVRDFVSFAHSTADVWARLATGVGAVDWDFLNPQIRVYEESAVAFWHALAAKREEGHE